MAHNAEERETGDIARNFFLQAVVLFAAMLLPYAVLHGFEAAIGSVVIVAAYMFTATHVKSRERPKEKPRRGDGKTFLLILMYVGAGFLAVSGIFGAVVVGWLGLAYTLGDEMLGGIGHALTMLAGGIVALALSIVLMHWGRGGLGALGRRIHRHGLGLFLAPWLSETVMLMLFLGVSVLMVIPIPLEIIVDNMYLGRRAFFPDGIWLFPFLPLGMFSTAVLAVAMISLMMDYSSFDAIVRALQEDDAKPAPRDGWWPALVAITLCASAGVMVSILWAFHTGLVAAAASVQAMTAGMIAVGDLDDWIAEREAAGRPITEIAALINENGHWSTADPGKGLPELLPELLELLPGLNEDVSGLGLKRECRIAIAAAPIDPAKIEAIDWPGMPDWTPALGGYFDNPEQDDETAGTEAAAQTEPDEPYEPPMLRYCVRAACASPVAWDAPPAVFLYSSHPSKSLEWMWLMYFDLFAVGRAPEPGGYCTADGRLSETYQG